jgi:hypothetical protein
LTVSFLVRDVLPVTVNGEYMVSDLDGFLAELQTEPQAAKHQSERVSQQSQALEMVEAGSPVLELPTRR